MGLLLYIVAAIIIAGLFSWILAGGNFDGAVVEEVYEEDCECFFCVADRETIPDVCVEPKPRRTSYTNGDCRL